jgi:hypothetical protein
MPISSLGGFGGQAGRDSLLEVAVTSELVSETTVSGLGVRMGVERPVNYLLKEKAGSTMLGLKTFLDSSRLGAALLGLILRVYKKRGPEQRAVKPLNYSHNFSSLVSES